MLISKGMPLVEIDVTEANQPGATPGKGGVGRRRLIGAGLGGAAVSLLPFLSGRSGATTVPPGTEPAAATTTTAPPRRPTADDVTLLTFAQSVELTARDLYDVALREVDFDDVETTVMATIRDAHQAYVNALSGLLGISSPSAPDEKLFTGLVSGFSGATDKVLQSAYDVESTLVATHTELVGQLVGVRGASLIASILVVEARHCTVIADMMGSTDLDVLLDSNKPDALAPAEG